MDSGGEILPPLPGWAVELTDEMAAFDMLGPLAPATLRQARRLARVFDQSPAVQQARVAALVTLIDKLTREEIARVEALAGSAMMRRLRRRARAAPGYQGGIV